MFGEVVQVGKILGSALMGGAVKFVQLAVTGIAGLATDGTPDGSDEAAEKTPDADMFNGFGLVGRPRAPDAKGYAEHVALRRGDRLQPVAYRDPRLQVPNLKEGAVGLAGYGGANLLFEPTADGNTGLASIYVPYAFSGGVATKAMTVSIDVRTLGEESLQVIHGDGMALRFNAVDKSANLRLDSKNYANFKPGEAFLQFDSIVLKGNASVGDPTTAVPFAKSAELLVWAALVNAALNSLGAPVAPLPPTVATTRMGGT